MTESSPAPNWNPPSLDELMADVAPLSADENFTIEDLTEQEWELFANALRD